MIKNNKVKFIISSTIILLPMLVALFIHNFVQPLLHGLIGAFVSFPLITLGIHILCLVLSDKIGNSKEQNQKVVKLIFWIIPIMTIYIAGLLLAISLGMDFEIQVVIAPLIGVMFIVMGNYMPKAVQNRTFGIKISWTLSSEENWNATHRFAGKVWVIVGAIILLTAFLPEKVFMIAFVVLLLVAIVSCLVFSYLYYKKMLEDGRIDKATVASSFTKSDKKIGKYSIVSIAVILVFVSIISFAGKVNFTFDDDSLCVEASFGGKMDIEYSTIESIEYREGRVDGTRVAGFGSAQLLYGVFRNNEFGTYTRYTYTAGESSIVLIVDGKVVVLADSTAQATRAIYDRLVLEIGR